MKTTRYSHQREVILGNVLSRKDHPTAEQIYEDVKREIPNISLGTVYRNLNFLAGEGKILKVDLEKSVFDSTLEGHNHMLCEKCGRVVDVDIDINTANFFDKLGNIITKADVRFTGICAQCKNL